jgi:hypothetical protein
MRDGVVVAQACWWTGPEDRLPAVLDWLEAMPGPEQVELSTQLLLVAHETMRNDEGMRPDYHLFLPPAGDRIMRSGLPVKRDCRQRKMPGSRRS